MQMVMIRNIAVDPAGREHETFSYDGVKFMVFGKLKSHKTWTSVASANTFADSVEAVRTLESQWRKGSEFTIAPVIR